MSKNEDKPPIDELLATASKGSGAEGAIKYLGDVLWQRLWKNIVAIANCDPEKKDIIFSLRASIQEDMYLAQSFKIDVFESREAIKSLKASYGIK